MQSKATTVDQYLDELESGRREAISQLRELVLANLQPGFEEGMQYGMIGYYVPHRIYAPGYHCDPQQPLPFVSMASQKNYCAFYAMCLYMDPPALERFQQQWKKTGKKLTMGKSCIRFQRFEDLATEVIARSLRAISVKKFIANYEKS